MLFRSGFKEKTHHYTTNWEGMLLIETTSRVNRNILHVFKKNIHF